MLLMATTEKELWMTRFISLLAGILFGIFALSGAEAKDEIVQVKVRFQANRIIGPASESASLPHPGAGVNTLLTEGRSVYRGRNYWHRRAQLVRAHWRQQAHRLQRAYVRIAADHAIREGGAPAEIHDMIARHATDNGVPVALAETVVRIESRFQPHVTNRSGATGLMQIKPQTARGMGFSGSPSGLLEPETNLRFGMKYLALAFRASGGDMRRAIQGYQTGLF
jgi:soluble lytic murein transglycosylase-like protein